MKFIMRWEFLLSLQRCFGHRLLPYVAALSIGLSFVGWTFSSMLLFNGVSPDTLLNGDLAQHVLGQRAYFADTWHWPLLRTTMLNWPNGISIAMTDSIPAIAMPLKLISFVLPRDFSAMQMWLAFAYMMQPVAAVFALRSAGENRLIPALVVAVFSISIPTFLFRQGHVALSSHFLLLLAVGDYFRMVEGRNGGQLLALLLPPISLLIHPYLGFMAVSILLAAPLTLADSTGSTMASG